ncbi:MAG: lipoate--protein ligase family protein [Chlorobiaceae bacterium]
MMNTLFSRVYCLDSGFHTGAENMEVDRRLMASFLDGRFQNRFGRDSCLWRFYAWRPYAVTLGYNQDVSGIDSDKCRSAGIDVVRRPTGGRAVFHAEEFTYSFLTESSEQNSELYRMVHEVIKLALESLGIHAEFCRSTLARPQGGGAPVAVSCFTASARYELQVDGRKLVGSAQRRTRNILLQHGSLPLSSHHKDLCTFVTLADGEAFEEIRNEMERKTTSLEEIVGYIPEYSRLVELMRSALQKRLRVEAVELHPDELSELIA